MRDIKFRGKTQDGKWVYGDLIHSGTDTIAILELDAPCLELVTDVVPDTIGQFTGLRDKNGTEVYEGDIIKIPETEFNIEMNCIVLYDRDGFCVKSIMSGSAGSLAWSLHKKDPKGNTIAVIIGNIHDNPELLKK